MASRGRLLQGFTRASHARVSLRGMDTKTLAPRVVALYEQASPPERVTLLNRLLRPLGPLDAGIGQQLLDQSPAGERKLAPALSQAAALLAAAPEAAGRTRAVLVLTDGAAAPADALGPALAELKAVGLAPKVWLHPGRFISAAELGQLVTDFGAAELLTVEGPESAAALWELLSAARPHGGPMAAQLTLVDTVAAAHALVEGSAQPAAVWDPAAGSLSWDLKNLKADRPTWLRYQLRPQGLGTRLAVDRQEGRIRYTDGQGQSGELRLPRPWLRVWGRAVLYLPWGE